MDELQAVFGSSVPFRFIVKKEDQEDVRCIDCNARWIAYKLEQINFEDGDTEIPIALNELRNAILFILYNTDWPVGE